MLFAVASVTALASLDTYDASISDDAAAGLVPVARLTSALAFDGTRKTAFNFGTNSGSATFEFILDGDPSPNPGSYLAVGENSQSNLRYELWRDTGQLGFTQLGVYDYAFTPGVPSPLSPAHVTYVWNGDTRTMRLFLNGHLAGTASGISDSFAMPNGPGWLGANPQTGEAMVGNIYRLTVYDGILTGEVIQSHADAFSEVHPPPVISLFSATPDFIFTPNTATLNWSVQNADALFLNGTNVTGQTNLTVAPLETTVWTLLATNTGGSTSTTAIVRVNPAPEIAAFRSNRKYCRPGESVLLNWSVQYATSISVTPEPGELALSATSAEVRPASDTIYLLTARNPVATNTASVSVHIVQPADHLLISEFMANDHSILADESGTHSGWIELHNPTAEPIDLSGYSLSDDPATPRRWTFPSTNLAAGAYIIVFASGENRVQPGQPLHTNFKLNNSGEYLALAAPDGSVIQEFAPVFPPQRPDISYGLLEDDPALLQYFGQPTPGARNTELLPAPEPVIFSRPSGTFTQPFPVTLSAPDPNAVIWFTLDGSAPAPLLGTRYSGPILVTNTAHLRAIAVANDLASRITGASYIMLGADLAAYTSPLPLMIIDNFGAGAIRRKGWNPTGAGIKQVPRQTAAWFTFERANGTGPGAFTNTPQMTSLIGIRGRGAYSTEWRQKPYSVAVIDEQGGDADASPLGMPEHSDWVLYFPDAMQSADPALLFNTFAYDLSRSMGEYAVRFRWVEAFINEDGGPLTLTDRRGVYAIIEKVARGKDRLDFQRLSPDGSNGGWLVNINRMDPEPDTGWPAPNGATSPWFFHTGGPDRVVQSLPNVAYNPVPGGDLPQQWNAFINFDNPNGYVISTNQRAAIETWFEQFESVLYNDAKWRDPVNGYRRYLDTSNFIDYFILNVLTRNGDGLLLSMFPWKGDDNKLRMGPAWDYNWSSYYISGGPTGSLMHRSDQLWYARLFNDPDFLQAYIDRWWELRRGPLSNAAMNAIIDRQSAEITPAKALLNGMPSASDWSSRLAQMKSWLNQRADWMDSNYLRPPVLNQYGGAVPDGFSVTLSASNATIWYTTDGTDPRAPGGAVAPSAKTYSGPLPLHAPAWIKTRAKTGATWSGLVSAYFFTPQDLSALAVTEIMYNPLPFQPWDSEDLEFLELQNRGTAPLDLSGLAFNSGIDFTFTNQTQLDPGAFFLLARNSAALAGRYPGVAVNGTFTGKLNNDGETLRLVTPSGATVFELTFSNKSPWPVAAAGSGFSAVPNKSAPANSNSGADWLPSTAVGGSPGAPEPAILSLTVASVTPDAVTLQFVAAPSLTCAIEYTDSLPSATWTLLKQILPQPAEHLESISDPSTRPTRFYRLTAH